MKKQTRKRIIYLRYILPPVLMLLTLVAMLIPSYKYVISGEVNDAMSLLDLLNSSFSASREVLFATTEQDAGNLLFSRVVFGLIIGFTLLWLVAFSAAVYSAIAAVKYFAGNDDDDLEKGRTLFVTFFPNRIFLSVIEAFVLPLTLLPYLMPSLYLGIWGMNVSMVLCAPDMLILTAVALLSVFILSALSAPWERKFDADLFKKSKKVAMDGEGDDSYESESNQENGEDDPERAEKNERIRQLLGTKNKK